VYRELVFDPAGMDSTWLEGYEPARQPAFALQAPQYDAVLAGTPNDSQVDRWPLVAALCRELRQAA
ncbi:MAG TPA: hypothetical protein VGF54_15565, partial [Streptosporangiaceae bacterium]